MEISAKYDYLCIAYDFFSSSFISLSPPECELFSIYIYFVIYATFELSLIVRNSWNQKGVYIRKEKTVEKMKWWWENCSGRHVVLLIPLWKGFTSLSCHIVTLEGSILHFEHSFRQPANYFDMKFCRFGKQHLINCHCKYIFNSFYLLQRV